MVEADPEGVPVPPSAARVRRVGDEYHFGGLYDRKLRRFVGPSREPKLWLCSKEQLPLLLHANQYVDTEGPSSLLAFGGEGAGKTETAAPWAVLKSMVFAGQDVYIGATSPTSAKVDKLRGKICARMRPEWFTYHARSNELRLAWGPTIEFHGVKKYSDEVGSRIQGQDWVAHVGDEIQDYEESIEDDIKTRGRVAPQGYYARFCTASAKRSRRFRDEVKRRETLTVDGRKVWSITKLTGPSNPFASARHWKELAASMSPNEARRRIFADYGAIENAVYYTYDERRNLRRRPQIGVRDVTSEILGARREVLIGHDPGRTQHASELTKCFEFTSGPDKGKRAWWVIDEVVTDGSAEAHALAVKKRLVKEYGLYITDRRGDLLPDSPTAICRADPYSNSSEDKPSVSIYKKWINAGIEIKPAKYNKANTGPGRILKDDRIEMVCLLLYNKENDDTLLYVDLNDDGTPVAPHLVDALESLERDYYGKAEVKVKGQPDKTHYPCALGYGLYPYEKVRIRRPIAAEGTP